MPKRTIKTSDLFAAGSASPVLEPPTEAQPTPAPPVVSWIKRVADDERKRDAVRLQGEEVAARKAELVRKTGRLIFDQLAAAVARDIELLAREFPDERARDLLLEVSAPRDGFIVRRSTLPAVSLTVDLHLETAALSGHYLFMSGSSLPPREERLELAFVDAGSELLQIKHRGLGLIFTTADALSEFLLVPVFTGRPR
jgi:hypothetical protein